MTQYKIKKRILVTGGSGFIGSAISNFLHKKNYNVIVYDNNYRGKLNRLDKKIKFIKGDIRNFKKFDQLVKKIKPNTIIHLAYINGTKRFYKLPHIILDIAVKGLINVFDCAIKYNVKNIFLASSSEVYNIAKQIPTPENIELKIPDVHNPRFSYSGGKILTEIMGINYGKKYFKKLIIFRPHNVYGKDMGGEHVIPELIEKIKNTKNKILKIQGTGRETRSFIHIDDFTEAFYKIFRKGKHLNIYNIGTQEEIKIKELAKIILGKCKKKLKILYCKGKSGSPFRRCPDTRKLKKLGFKYKISISSGIEKILSI